MDKSPLPSFKFGKTAESLDIRHKKLDHMAKKQDAITFHLQLCVGKWDFRHSWEYWDDIDHEKGDLFGLQALQDYRARRRLYMATQRAFSKESPYRLVAEHKTTEQKLS